MKPLRIFISSVQNEFAEERQVLRDWLCNDPLMHRFYEPFLFEHVPASVRRANEIYLNEVTSCDVYIGLFGNDYGYEDADGISPTEREFVSATEQHKTRLIFVKGRCREAGLPEPEFAISTGIFTTTIRRKVSVDTSITGQVPGKYRASTGQVPGKSPDKSS